MRERERGSERGREGERERERGRERERERERHNGVKHRTIKRTFTVNLTNICIEMPHHTTKALDTDKKERQQIRRKSH